VAKFIGNLVVQCTADTEDATWELVQPLSFQSDVAGLTFTAPVGFVTDFCSVPRVIGVYDLLGDRARMSGTIHDHLYSTHEVTREIADSVLREMLMVDGIEHVEAEEFYLAVRIGGASHW
jgi:hypothetical protein